MLRVHVIMDESDRHIVEAVGGLDGVSVVQWDYGFDTAYQWTVHNENAGIDVFLASEYAQVSTVDSEGKQLKRDAALLRRIRDLYLLRPKVKFLLLCDEARDMPENRHFLSHLVNMGIYDFRTQDEFPLPDLEEAIKEPKRTIAHVQAYLTDAQPKGQFQPPEKQAKKDDLKIKAIDIFAAIAERRKSSAAGNEAPEEKVKVKHVIEKTRSAVIAFRPVGSSAGDSALLAQAFAVTLAKKGAKVALIEIDGYGVPRIGFGTGVRSPRKSTETALQRIEDEEDIAGLLINSKELLGETPGYDSAILNKLKALPETLHVLAGRESVMPDGNPHRSLKPSTLDAAPGEIVNQLIFRHGFDAVVFALSGDLHHKIVFHTLKVSNHIYCVTDQHPAHISWLRQTLRVMDKIGVPQKNMRTVIFPAYELKNVSRADIDAALGLAADYRLPDVRKELIDAAWGEGEVNDKEFGAALSEMIMETTGYRTAEDAKEKRRFSLFRRAKKPQPAAEGGN